MASWFVIGISGVSCAGKTTLAKSLYDFLLEYKKGGHRMSGQFEGIVPELRFSIGTVDLIHQDDYFYPENSAQHKRVEVLNHINWELISALDSKRMCGDIEQILSRDLSFTNEEAQDILMAEQNTVVNFLIIEGFILFEDHFINALCNIKFHMHLSYEKCFARRKQRVYTPPDVVGYYEMCVWPLYEKYFRDRIKDRKEIRLLNADLTPERCFNFVLNTIFSVLN